MVLSLLILCLLNLFKLKIIFLFSHRIAQCFAFLTCTKWYNPEIHRHSHITEPSSSSIPISYLDWDRGLVVTPADDHYQSRICNLQDIGGHVMKVPWIVFQILLFMRLEVKAIVNIYFQTLIFTK